MIRALSALRISLDVSMKQSIKQEGWKLSMIVKSVKSVRHEVFLAYEAAKTADANWQAELDRLKVERYSQAARGCEGSELRRLYESKIAADRQYLELVEILRRYQDPNQGAWTE